MACEEDQADRRFDVFGCRRWNYWDKVECLFVVDECAFNGESVVESSEVHSEGS